MLALLRFIGRRVTTGHISRHPWVRRILVIAAVMRWIDKRFFSRSQQFQLKRGETLVVSVVKNKEATS